MKAAMRAGMHGEEWKCDTRERIARRCGAKMWREDVAGRYGGKNRGKNGSVRHVAEWREKSWRERDLRERLAGETCLWLLRAEAAHLAEMRAVGRIPVTPHVAREPMRVVPVRVDAPPSSHSA